MKRFECMQALAGRLKDELIILSLGASVDEWYNAAPHMRAASLFQQQLGCVTPQAFGLAVGLPHRRIVSLDTDGGMLFNLGILATLANEQPANLFIVVWDNQCYQSIGGPPTHTAGRVDIAAIARGAGIEHAYTVRDLDEVERLGFHFFAAGVQVSHGYAHLEEFNVPVKVFGMEVAPGDLLHADQHGAVVIPHEIAREVAGAAKRVELREKPLLAACRLADPLDELDRLISPEY